MATEKSVEELQKEIEYLKQQLRSAQCDISNTIQHSSTELPSSLDGIALSRNAIEGASFTQERGLSFHVPAMHPLLLLADSALPLGSFAYSSGLESYLAHIKSQPPNIKSSSVDDFHKFLALSISSLASTTLPYVLKAYRYPDQLETLDNDLDASTPCTVARRASVAQGLALLGVWERAYKASYRSATASPAKVHTSSAAGGAAALDAFSEALKNDPEDAGYKYGVNGHIAPLWGVVCVAMGVGEEEAGYVFMLNHAKAVLSAAVRASVMGPYQAQAVLASNGIQTLIGQRMEREWGTEPDDAGQNVPVLDLWLGRHELLYSRIFNS